MGGPSMGAGGINGYQEESKSKNCARHRPFRRAVQLQRRVVNRRLIFPRISAHWSCTRQRAGCILQKTHIYAGSVVEIAPVLVFRGPSPTPICNYAFAWGNGFDEGISLGWSSLMNHSYTPNVQYEMDTRRLRIIFPRLPRHQRQKRRADGSTTTVTRATRALLGSP